MKSETLEPMKTNMRMHKEQFLFAFDHMMKIFKSFLTLLVIYKMQQLLYAAREPKNYRKTAIFLCCVSFSFIVIGRVVANIRANNKAIDKTIIVQHYLPSAPKGDTDAFLHELALLESSNRFDSKNGSFNGKYMMGPRALTDIGIIVTIDDFKKDTMLQKVAVMRYLRKNKEYLKEYIGKYNSTMVGDIYIDESALLAGAHLAGSTNVIKFLESGGKEEFRDGNGTSIKKYMRELGGYKLKL